MARGGARDTRATTGRRGSRAAFRFDARPAPADKTTAAGRGRACVCVDDAPHRLRRLVDRDLDPRVDGALAVLLDRTAFAAASAAGPVCRLRDLAAPVARGD